MQSLGSGHTVTAHGKAQVSRDKDTCSGAGVHEGATSPLRWRRCNQAVHLCHSSLPWVFCHTQAQAQQQPQRAQSCHLAGPCHTHPASCKGGQMSQRALSPQGSFQRRGQRPGFAQAPFPQDGDTVGPPLYLCVLWVPLLCHSPDSPLSSTSITPTAAPSCALGA